MTINSGIQIVELIKFEPVTLERLGCIPTRSIGTSKKINDDLNIKGLTKKINIYNLITRVLSVWSEKLMILNLLSFRNLTDLN